MVNLLIILINEWSLTGYVETGLKAVNCPSSPLTKPLQVIFFQKQLYEKYIHCVKQLHTSIKTKFILLISDDFVGIESDKFE